MGVFCRSKHAFTTLLFSFVSCLHMCHQCTGRVNKGCTGASCLDVLIMKERWGNKSVGVEPPWLSWWNFSVVHVSMANIFEQWSNRWKISWVRSGQDQSLRMNKECNIGQFGSLINLPFLVTLPTSILSSSSLSYTVKYDWANCRANSLCHTSGTRELAFHLCPLFLPLQWGLSQYWHHCTHCYKYQYHTEHNTIER
jgi:hypothetical protein